MPNIDDSYAKEWVYNMLQELWLGEQSVDDVFEELEPYFSEKDEWRPIEGAPKDGTKIRLLDTKTNKFEVGGYKDGQWVYGYDRNGLRVINPDYWAPY